MADRSNFTPAPRKKIALDNRKLSLSAKCPSAPGKYSTLIWSLVNNNPRVTVYTNDPADATPKNDNGRISANMDAPNFFALLELLEQVSNAEGPTRMKIENKNFIFPGGKRSEKPVVVSELVVGKDDNGIIWISVLAYDKERPKIKFQFLPNEFHNYIERSGEPFNPANLSKLYVKGYINLMRGIMTNLLVSEYVEPPKKEEGNNRGGKSWGRQESAPVKEDTSDIDEIF